MELHYINATFKQGDVIHFSLKESKHIKTVLRKKNGSTLVVTNGSTQYATGILEITEKNKTILHIKTVHPIIQPVPELILAFGLFRHPRMEIMIEKCTELGISKFIPLHLQHVSHPAIKPQRLQNITVAAIKQSLQYLLPKITPPSTLEELLQSYSGGNQNLILFGHPEESATSVQTHLPLNAYHRIIMVIGPEGGFNPTEISLLKQAGASSVQLSPTRLRSETAAITMVAQVVAQLL